MHLKMQNRRILGHNLKRYFGKSECDLRRDVIHSSNMKRKVSGICWNGDLFAFVFPDPILLHYPNATVWEGI